MLFPDLRILYREDKAMCGNTTKQRIGAALRQLMTEQHFDKITVQNLMDVTNMKRQSFYYHFRDTRDVLLWICRQELVEPLLRSDLEFSDWLMLALTIIDRDRVFYRKVMAAAHPEIIRQIGRQVLWQRTAELLYGHVSGPELDTNQRYVVEFFVQSVLVQFFRFASSRTPLEAGAARERIAALLAVVRKDP